MNISDLIQGHEQFKKHLFQLHEKEFFDLIDHGQHPKSLFIGCSDSRVVPSLITNAKPGSFFTVRNVGNLVPPYTQDNPQLSTPSAIEYAVEILKVSDIIVCGHFDCGACASLFNPPPAENFPHLNAWLQINENTKKLAMLSKTPDTTDEQLYRLTEHISILCQIENLLTYPFIKSKVTEEKIFIHGWYYDIAKGELEYYDTKNFEFRSLTEFMAE